MLGKLLRRIDACLRTQSPSVRASQVEIIDVLALEPRILYSVAPLPDVSTTIAANDPLPSSALAPSESSDSFGGPETDVTFGLSEPTANDPLAGDLVSTELNDWFSDPGSVSVQSLQTSHEMVFIDMGVSNFQQLLDGILSTNHPHRVFEVVLLSTERDGVEQITESLANRSGIDAVHIVSHGSSGAIQLGSTRLSNENLLSYAGQIAAWGNSLEPDADLLLYGCNLATEAGSVFVESLAVLCDCDVAASEDLTGHASRGANWNFEFTIGTVDAENVFSPELQAAWLAILAPNNAPEFGIGDGIVNTDFGAATFDFAQDMILQSDGKIVVLGHHGTAGNYDFALTRYHTDGTLDTDFGIGGKVTTDFFGGSDFGKSIVQQADGKLVVTGVITQGGVERIGLARYNVDGTLDASFGSSGKAVTSVGATTQANSIALQTDGKIVVGGYSGSDAILVRYSSSGALDTTFDSDGVVINSVGTTQRINAIAVLSDGNVIAVGQVDNYGAVFRYTTAGALDTGFNATGYQLSSSANSEYFGLAVQVDGRLVTTGYEQTGGVYDWTVSRYTSSGAFDTTFNGTGKAIVSQSNDFEAGYDVAIQNDGNIVVAGSSYASAGNPDFTAVRFTGAGALDPSFNGTGYVSQPFGTLDGARAVAIQGDGKIVVAGFAQINHYDFIVLRYHASGSLDLGFDSFLTNSLNNAPHFIENGSAVFLDGDVSVSDLDLDGLNGGLGDYAGASLTLVRNGGLSVEDIFGFIDGNGISFDGTSLLKAGVSIATFDRTTAPGSVVVTFTSANGQVATSADVDHVIRQITYSNSSDLPPATVQIDWSFSDGNLGAQGDGGPLQATGSVVVTISATNDTPENLLPGPRVTAINTPHTISGAHAITITDPDAGSNHLRVSLTAVHGTMTLASLSGLSFSAGDGTTDSSLVFTGTIASINTALDGLVFTPTVSFSGNASVAILTEDLGNTGSGGSLSDFDTLNIQVGAVNFQQGLNGYTGTEDTFVQSFLSGSSFGSHGSVEVESGLLLLAIKDGLIRFDHLFGHGTGQIPLGSTITNANLSVYVSQSDFDLLFSPSVRLHAMNSGWSEASTWNSLVGGIQTNGVEANSVASAGVSAEASGWVTFAGLAGDVQNWLDGAPNYGWALLTTDADSWAFRSSEYGTVAYRPYLAVSYNTPVAPVLDLDANDSSGSAGVSFQTSFTEGSAAVLVVDSDASLADPDDLSLESLTARIVNLQDGALESISGSTLGTSIVSSYDWGTGTLTFSGTDTVANYRQVLRSIRYENLSDSPNLSPRLIEIVASDGVLDSATATSTISILASNDAPTISQLGGDTRDYFEGNGAAVIDQGVLASIADVDSPDFEGGSLTVSFVSGGVPSQDVLSIRNQGTGSGQIAISGSNVSYSGTVFGTFSGGTGAAPLVITFNANANTTAVAALMQNVTFSNNDSDNPTGGLRQIGFAIQDGDGGTSSTQVASVSVFAVNDDPVNVGTLPVAVSVTEDMWSDVNLSLVHLSDVDHNGGNLTVTLSSATGGNLQASSGGGVVVVGSGTGVLTLTGTVADLNALFDAASSIRYLHSTANLHGNHVDTVSISASDSGSSGLGGGGVVDLGSVNIDIASINDEPLVLINSPATVAEGSSGNVLSPLSLMTSDVDHLAGQVTYAVIAAPSNGHVFRSGIGLGNGDTFTQADIDNGWIAYSHDGSETSTDSLEFSVGDGIGAASLGTFNWLISGVNDAPLQATIEGFPLAYIENAGPVPVTATLTMSDSDSLTLVSATVRISNNYIIGEDVLTFANQSGIVGSWNAITGTMMISGSAATIEYETALRSIRYENSSDNPSLATRTIAFTVNDGQLDSNVQSREVAVLAVNDAPLVGFVESAVLSYVENDGPRTLTSTLVLSDTDDALFASATVTISGNYALGQDRLGFVDQNGIQGTWDAMSGTLTLTGSTSLGQYEAALRSVTFENASEIPDTATRTVTFTVNDGDADSNSMSRQVTITSVNDAPQSLGTPNSVLTVTEDALSLLEIDSVQFFDVDDNGQPLLLSLSTTTGGNLTAFAGGGVTITGNGSSSIGLSGTATDLNAFLRSSGSVLYLHQMPHRAGTAVDTLIVSVNDLGNTGVGGGLPVVLGTLRVDITNVNDAPLAVDDTVLAVEDTNYAGNVLANDVDIDGDALNALLLVGPRNGILDFQLDGTFTYTPGLNYNGFDHFTYRATDGHAVSHEGAVLISIAAVNDPPVANPNHYDLRAGAVLSLTNGASILNNDLDPDGDRLTAVLISGPTNGTLTLSSDGSFLFHPEGGYVGEVSFTYAVTDGNAISAPTTVSIAIFSAAELATDLPVIEPDDEEDEDSDRTTRDLTSDAISTYQPSAIETFTEMENSAVTEASHSSDHGATPQILDRKGDETKSSPEQALEIQRNTLSNDHTTGHPIVRTKIPDALEKHMQIASRCELKELEYTLDSFRDDVRRLDDLHDLVTGTATTVFVGTTATAAVWLMNSTYFAALLSSSLPIWARFDPIFIVKNSVSLKVDDDTSLATIIQEDAGRGNESPR